MPYSPNKPCRHPGCSKLINPKEMYCEKHKALHPVEYGRTSASKRGYSSKWQKESKKFLATHPFCAECSKRENKLTPATVVDHIQPHRGNQKLFWDWSNWQPLCKACHDKKTGIEDRWVEYKY